MSEITPLELKRIMARIEKATPKQLSRELGREAETIMTLSKQKFVPVDLGILRSSGFVKQTKGQRGGDQVEFTLGFGGPAAAYAVVQHERMDYNHTVGGPKYLERPATLQANGMAQRIAKRLKVGQ